MSNKNNKKQDSIKVRLTKSPIGKTQDQKDTVKGLGLRKLNSTRILEKTPSVLGMIRKVRHLVTAEEL